MSRHTSGPWVLDSENNIKDSDGNCIADAWDFHVGDERRKANARLIAKAPELLARLEGLLSVINQDSDGGYFICQEAQNSIDDANALIDQLKEPIA